MQNISFIWLGKRSWLFIWRDKTELREILVTGFSCLFASIFCPYTRNSMYFCCYHRCKCSYCHCLVSLCHINSMTELGICCHVRIQVDGLYRTNDTCCWGTKVQITTNLGHEDDVDLWIISCGCFYTSYHGVKESEVYGVCCSGKTFSLIQSSPQLLNLTT